MTPTTTVKPGDAQPPAPPAGSEVPAPKPSIFVLAEQMPREPQHGHPVGYAVQHKCGYWTHEQKELAQKEAERRNLVVLEIVDALTRP